MVMFIFSSHSNIFKYIMFLWGVCESDSRISEREECHRHGMGKRGMREGGRRERAFIEQTERKECVRYTWRGGEGARRDRERQRRVRVPPRPAPPPTPPPSLPCLLHSTHHHPGQECLSTPPRKGQAWRGVAGKGAAGQGTGMPCAAGQAAVAGR